MKVFFGRKSNKKNYFSSLFFFLIYFYSFDSPNAFLFPSPLLPHLFVPPLASLPPSLAPPPRIPPPPSPPPPPPPPSISFPLPLQKVGGRNILCLWYCSPIHNMFSHWWNVCSARRSEPWMQVKDSLAYAGLGLTHSMFFLDASKTTETFLFLFVHRVGAVRCGVKRLMGTFLML